MEGIDWRDCPAVLPLPVAGGGHCGFYDWRAEALSVRAIGGFFEGVVEGAWSGQVSRSPASGTRFSAAADRRVG
jgi:hypothetical protein